MSESDDLTAASGAGTPVGTESAPDGYRGEPPEEETAECQTGAEARYDLPARSADQTDCGTVLAAESTAPAGLPKDQASDQDAPPAEETDADAEPEAPASQPPIDQADQGQAQPAASPRQWFSDLTTIDRLRDGRLT
ncbi:MAG: hypothetical protein LBI99_10005, partial [Propionibacteriaceae bacterium]|nr:hypothetical protein [Propionibacteriaceae bacterium]